MDYTLIKEFEEIRRLLKKVGDDVDRLQDEIARAKGMILELSNVANDRFATTMNKIDAPKPEKIEIKGLPVPTPTPPPPPKPTPIDPQDEARETLHTISEELLARTGHPILVRIGEILDSYSRVHHKWTFDMRLNARGMVFELAQYHTGSTELHELLRKHAGQLVDILHLFT